MNLNATAAPCGIRATVPNLANLKPHLEGRD